METVLTHVAGLDVHQARVVATVRVPGEGRGGRRRVTETFGTMTEDLLALRDWLQAHDVTHVAIESTGVYWKPVYYVLEDRFTVLVVNTQHVKRVPGRKTDVQDSDWLAQLLECGLLRGSFVPPPVIRILRDLTRYRHQQVADRAREVNRLCKVLEDAGVKLSTVASDVLGVSGTAMLQALVAGTTDPVVLADLARGKLRQKIPALRRALTGRFRPHHTVLLQHILAKIDFLDEALQSLTMAIDEQLHPFEPVLARLDTIPGIDRRAAVTLVAETGADMSRFPTAGHLCSWAGLCPGHHESAGKRQSGHTRDGNRYLRGVLIQAALAASRKRQSSLQALYHRVKGRRGHKKAVVAVSHQLLEIAYYLMRTDQTYLELGGDYVERRHKERAIQRHLRQLTALGVSVQVVPAA